MNLWQWFRYAMQDERGQFDFDVPENLPQPDTGGGDDTGGLFMGPPQAPDAGGGFGGFARSIFGDLGSGISDFGSFARGLMPIAQLGAAGLGLASGIQGSRQLSAQTKLAEDAAKRQAQIAQTAQSAAQPFQQFAGQQLGRAQAGQLDPAIEAQIAQWTQGAKAQVMDYFSRAGLGSSSMLQSELARIDQMAVAMRAEALQNMEQLGLSAGGTVANILGTASGAAGAGGQQAAQQQFNLQDLIAQANRALGTISGAA